MYSYIIIATHCFTDSLAGKMDVKILLLFTVGAMLAVVAVSSPTGYYRPAMKRGNDYAKVKSISFLQGKCNSSHAHALTVCIAPIFLRYFRLHAKR